MATSLLRILTLVTVLVTFQSSAFALTDSKTQSVVRLGELNGIALHCKHMEHARHLKLSLAQSLPKLRGLGELFEDETNRSFLKFIQSGEMCPGEATMRGMIDKAIANMKSQYGESK